MHTFSAAEVSTYSIRAAAVVVVTVAAKSCSQPTPMSDVYIASPLACGTEKLEWWTRRVACGT